MKIRYFYCQSGFNLLEIVVTLIIASILGSMIYVYFASSVTQSTTAVTTLKRACLLHAVMENITADYYSPSISDIYKLKDNIGSEDPNNTKNKYSPNSADPHHHYYVIQNRFIKFVSGVETDIAAGDPKDILKVTIKNDGGILTALFTPK